MHFSSENLHDPARLQALLKALRLPLWTRRDEPLFDEPAVMEQPVVVAAVAPSPLAPTAAAAARVVAATRPATAKKGARRAAATKPQVDTAKQEKSTPVAEAPRLNFVFIRVEGMLWIAERDDWSVLAALLPNIMFFMAGKAESQQARKPSYLEWPLPGIKADQSEEHAIQALAGKTQISLQPGDQLLLLGDEINNWLDKCPKAYAGHDRHRLPDAKSLSTSATDKRALWLHLNKLKKAAQTH